MAAAEVRAAIARAGISREDLARATGIEPRSLARKLRGTSPMGVDELADIARALGIRPSDLFRAAVTAAAA